MDKIAKALARSREEKEQERGRLEGALHEDNFHQGTSSLEKHIQESVAENEAVLLAEQSTSVPSVHFSGTIDPKLVVYHDTESLAAEHFKLIRSRILHPTDGTELKTIMVTSAMDNAGKTLVACNLALSIAQGVDPYALLIDADVRRSSIPRMFGFRSDVGLTDYLQGRSQFAHCLVKPGISKLTILPAGNSVSNPAEIITSSRMRALLQEAKSRYSDRFIIIDSPPVNMASETVDLAKLVDAVLFVVRCGASSKPLIEEAIKRIGKNNIMGIVFNAYDRPSGKYGYYY